MSGAHRSLWDHTLPADERHGGRSAAHPTDGFRTDDRTDDRTDVVIVGAGYTGLWTAYYLSQADPGLSITVLERDTVGFGASGRNGGWCSALLPVSLSSLACDHGDIAVTRLQRAMHETVDEVLRVAATEGIDCDAVKGGTLDLVRSPAQAMRARAHLDEHRRFGFGDDDLRWLDPVEVGERCHATRVLGALWSPHCAALHPARLVHGLARVLTQRGITIHEHTAVTEIGEREVRVGTTTIRAEVVVRATEAYTAQLPTLRRSIVPLYSLMIATEPLSDEVWASIGLTDRATFADHRHTVIYGQRTADDRIAFGGRGAPYHFGSAIEARFDTHDRVRRRLEQTLGDLFPAVRGARVTHHWGGPIGVPRDLRCSISFDPRTGAAAAGGYVGDGVATANLAGRVLADLIVRNTSDLVDLPWIAHRSRQWEPEPIRWLGINGVRLAASLTDRAEFEKRAVLASLGTRVMRAVGRN